MGDSLPPSPELSEHKSRSSSNNGIKRNKVSRACDECRKRKVRCDGAQPCAKCHKALTECIFSNVTPKRGPPKQYLEPFEARLKAIDTVLQVLDVIPQTNGHEYEDYWELKDPVIQATDSFDTDALGRPLYVPSTRSDYIEPRHTQQSLSFFNNISPTPILLGLLQIYFKHVHPSMPMISKSILTDQDGQSSSLLLNAIYAISCHYQNNSNDNNSEPPGWSYYTTAIGLIDTYADAPRLSTVQALLLLVKYHEYVHRPGFFWRTKFYLQLAIKMAHDLNTTSEGQNQVEIEAKRRTLWVTNIYDVLMSTEHGLQPFFTGRHAIEYPHVLSTESNSEADALLNFCWLCKVIHTHAAVIQFMRQKYSLKNDLVEQYANENYDESKEFSQLEETLTELGKNIPQISKTECNIHACFTHLIHHLTTILLYRPFALPGNQYTANHTDFIDHCLSSSLLMTQIIDRQSRRDGFEIFYSTIRGHQQIVYCLTAAATIQRSLKDFVKPANEYEKTSSLLQIFVQKSPVTELDIKQYAADKTFSNASSARSSPRIPTSTIRKRHSRSSLNGEISYGKQSVVSDTSPRRIRSNTSASNNNRPYASNRLSAPSLGSLFQQQHQQHQQHLQQQYLQQQYLQQQQQQQLYLNQQSYSQPPSPTAQQFNPENAASIPHRTVPLQKKTSLHRSASSTGEFVLSSQRNSRSNSTRPYNINSRRHTLTNSTPPDIYTVITPTPSSSTSSASSTIMLSSSPQPNRGNLQFLAVRNNRFSMPIMSNTQQFIHMIPTQYQSQQQYLQQATSNVLDPAFPLDPAIPDSPNESMMGLLLL